MRKVQDERITSQVHKYGYEAFILTFTLLFVFFIIKTYILDTNAMKEFIFLMIGFGYFAVRCALGGAVSMPSNGREKKALSKKILIGTIALSLIWGIFVAIRNTYLYMDGRFSEMSIFIGVISAGSFFFLGVLCFILFLGLSSRSNKDMEEGNKNEF